MNRHALIFAAQELVHFGVRQAQACLFAGAMLAAVLVTTYVWPQGSPITRYDFLFFYALAIQAALIACKLESIEEVKVIFVFHVVGTIMEIFKTHMGSWTYPEANLIRIGGVPLFSGFMYSSIGSYIARVWRIFEFRFDHLPSPRAMATLCALIYINFFTHHYMYDIRYFLFVWTAFLFWRTKIYYKPNKHMYWMPLLLGFVLVSFFIWVAENIGSFTSVWLYPHQMHGWHMVHMAKMGSWFLLMIISFVLVSLLHQEHVPSPRK